MSAVRVRSLQGGRSRIELEDTVLRGRYAADLHLERVVSWKQRGSEERKNKESR